MKTKDEFKADGFSGRKDIFGSKEVEYQKAGSDK